MARLGERSSPLALGSGVPRCSAPTSAFPTAVTLVVTEGGGTLVRGKRQGRGIDHFLDEAATVESRAHGFDQLEITYREQVRDLYRAGVEEPPRPRRTP